MGTKMKGLLKGLRYITQKFDENKEQEMTIGYPTDVKHVAHIGWDGPSVDSPSWMREFKSPQGFQSAPLSANGEPLMNQEIKWVSEDSNRRSLRSKKSTSQDMPELPKSSKPFTSVDSTSQSTKSRQSRKHSSNSSKSSRQPKDKGVASDSSSQNASDLPKKSHRKKSKESVGGSSRSSRSKANASRGNTSLPLDTEPDSESQSGSISNEFLSQSSSSKPLEKGRDKECNGIS